jgi:hypothetical protein
MIWYCWWWLRCMTLVLIASKSACNGERTNVYKTETKPDFSAENCVAGCKLPCCLKIAVGRNRTEQTVHTHRNKSAINITVSRGLYWPSVWWRSFQMWWQYNTIQHNTTQHNTTQHNTTQHNTTQHNTTQYNTTQQHNTTQYNTIQHNTTQYNTIQHNTTQHNTIQHKLITNYAIQLKTVQNVSAQTVSLKHTLLWCRTFRMDRLLATWISNQSKRQINVGNTFHLMNGLPSCVSKHRSDSLHHLHCLHNTDHVSWCHISRLYREREVTVVTAKSPALQWQIACVLQCHSSYPACLNTAVVSSVLPVADRSLRTGVLVCVCIARYSCVLLYRYKPSEPCVAPIHLLPSVRL